MFIRTVVVTLADKEVGRYPVRLTEQGREIPPQIEEFPSEAMKAFVKETAYTDGAHRPKCRVLDEQVGP